MGETQRMVLGALEQAARAKGHELRFLCSVCDPETGDTTFIHSKVLIVDDRFLSVGSANFTERSMGFDSELSLIWEAVENPALERDIRRVRASLLAEHASRDAALVDQSSRSRVRRGPLGFGGRVAAPRVPLRARRSERHENPVLRPRRPGFALRGGRADAPRGTRALCPRHRAHDARAVRASPVQVLTSPARRSPRFRHDLSRTRPASLRGPAMAARYT